jgi:hypothetical protein
MFSMDVRGRIAIRPYAINTAIPQKAPNNGPTGPLAGVGVLLLALLSAALKL